MEFLIEKGIPLPGGQYKYPFSKMEVGDSFIVGKYGKSLISTTYQSFYNFCKKEKLDWKVTIRKEGPMLRIWRVK